MKTLLVAEYREGKLRAEYTQLIAFARELQAEAAMFLVGGSIIGHGFAAVHHGIDGLVQRSGGFGWAVSLLGDAVVGLVTGAVVLGVVTAIQRVRKGIKAG